MSARTKKQNQAVVEHNEEQRPDEPFLQPMEESCATNMEESVPLRPKPPDGGWGWVVVVGSFYIAATFFAAVFSFGILFNEPLRHMNVSSTTAAWMVNIYVFLWNIACAMTAPLCEVFSWRTVGFTGFLIASLAYMLLYFATTPLHFIILFSVICGTAGGLSGSIYLLVLPAYFDKLRGAAMAIAMVGVSVGQIAVPLILRLLLQEFGFRGATLIFGGLLLNCCVAALVFHPVEWHQTKRLSRVTPKISLKQPKEPSLGKIEVICKVFKAAFKHIKGVKQLRVTLSAFSLSCIVVGYVNFLAQFPFAMAMAGYEANVAAWCISVSAFGGLAIRIIIIFISDRSWFSRRICYVSGGLLAGLSSIVTVLVLDRLELVLCSLVLLGVGTGAVISVYYPLVQDITGIALYATSVSLTGFFMAATGLAIGPLFGLIRDKSSYTWSMGACGALEVLCALVFIFMPCAIKLDAKMNADKGNT